MSGETEYQLARRLAKSVGCVLREFQESETRSNLFRKRGRFRLFRKRGRISIGRWFRRTDVLRGGLNLSGLLDIGTMWFPDGITLPNGITRDSSDEEIDLRLTAIGF